MILHTLDKIYGQWYVWSGHPPERAIGIKPEDTKAPLPIAGPFRKRYEAMMWCIEHRD